MFTTFLFLSSVIGVAHVITLSDPKCHPQRNDTILVTPSFNNTIRTYRRDKNKLIKSISIMHPSWSTTQFFKSEVPAMRNLNLFVSEGFYYAPNCESLVENLRETNEGNIFLIMEQVDTTTHFNFIDNAFLQPALRKNYRININKATIEKCDNASVTICENLYCSREKIQPPGDKSQKILNVAWRKHEGSVEFLAQLPDKLLHCEDSDQPLELEELILYHSTVQSLDYGSYVFLQTEVSNKEYIMKPTFSLESNRYVFLAVKMCRYCNMTIALIDGEPTQQIHLSGRDYPTSMSFEDQIDTSEWQEVILGGNQSCNSCSIKIKTSSTDGKEGLWVMANNLKIIAKEPPTEPFSCKPIERDYELMQTYQDKENSLTQLYGLEFSAKTLFYKTINNGENVCIKAESMKVKHRIDIEKITNDANVPSDGTIVLKWYDKDTNNAPYSYRIEIKDVNCDNRVLLQKSKTVAYNKKNHYIDVVILDQTLGGIYEVTISSSTSEGKLSLII